MLNNVPRSGQNLDETREDIRQNFSTIDTAFSVDHVSYNDVSTNQGKHNKVTLPALTGTFTAGATENVLFSNGTDVFIARNNQTQATAMNVTKKVSGANGYFKLLNGVTVKYGQLTATGSTTIAFPSGGGIPAFTGTPFFVQLTRVVPNNALVPARLISWNTNNTTDTDLAVVITDASGAPAQATFTFLAFGFTANP